MLTCLLDVLRDSSLTVGLSTLLDRLLDGDYDVG